MSRKKDARDRAAEAKARRLIRIRERHQVILRRQRILERIRMEARFAELEQLFDEPCAAPT